MNRSHVSNAIILSLKPQGENNNSVALLTDSNEITYATLYGGPKSKLRSLISPYNSGKIWLYENPEKNQIKISDFEVTNYHTSFSQNLFKIYAASLACELAIKTKCAGNHEDCFKIISGFLDGMEISTEEQSRVGLVRFLWRFLILMGVQPIVDECEQCNRNFFNSQFEINDFSYYNSIDNSFICSDCAKAIFTGNNSFQKSFYFPIKLNALYYFEAITNLSPAEVRKINIDFEAYEQMKQIVFFLIEKNIGQKLNSIETGVGIL